MENYNFIIDASSAGVRIDKWITDNVDSLTRNAVQRLLEEKAVTVNGKAVSKNYKLRENDSLSIDIPAPKELVIEAQNIPIEIVYEDNDLLVVNKPKGMVVHPAPGNEDQTLVNALMYHCKDSLSGINGVIRPGIVHRIDKDTSGLLMVAKNDTAHLHLAEQIKEHSFKRIYEAVVYGNVKKDEQIIDLPIGRHPVDRKKMAVTAKNSRNALTIAKVLQRYDGFTHMQFELKTGRTHQIRVHMSYLGHPIAGDAVYGPKKVITSLNGQCLHARTLGFVHPSTGEYMEFTSDLPQYFTKFLSSLRSI